MSAWSSGRERDGERQVMLKLMDTCECEVCAVHLPDYNINNLQFDSAFSTAGS